MPTLFRKLNVFFLKAGEVGFAFGFAPNAGHRNGPKRNEVYARDQLGQKGWQEFPVPPEEVSHGRGDTEVEQVIGGRECTFHEAGKHGDLENVGDNGESHRRHEFWSGGNGDGIIRHKQLWV